MDGIVRFVGQQHALIIFGLSGAVMLLFGAERGIWVINRMREVHQLATATAILSVLLGVLGAMTLFTGIVLYSVRGFLRDLTQRAEDATGQAPALIGRYWPLAFFGVIGFLLLLAGEAAGLRVVQVVRDGKGVAVGTALVCALFTITGALSMLTGFTLQSIRNLLQTTLDTAPRDESSGARRAVPTVYQQEVQA